MIKRNVKSLEDAVRLVQQRYKNRPSPLALMNENRSLPQPESIPGYQSPADPRSNLLGNFRPPNDTFR